MPSFLVDHIDSLLAMLFGVLFTLYAFLWDKERWTRRSAGDPLRNFMAMDRTSAPADKSSERRERGRAMLRIGGPILVGIGVLLFLIENPHPPVPRQVDATWQRASTDDGRATAEFPQPPEVQHRVDKAFGFDVDR